MHPKRENPIKTRIPGAMGLRLWKNVGNDASEEGKSCEKPKSFGAVGPNTWNNRGNLASEEGSSCEKLRILGVMGGET